MELIEQIQLALKELAIAQKETKLAQKQTEQQLKRTMEVLSNVGHNNGEFAEYYFYNALRETMTLGGIKYDFIEKNIHQRSKRVQDEFDVVMYNGNSIALVECKYKAHTNDLKRLVQSKTQNFKALNPDYANYNIYCGLASFTFYPELEEEAKQLGVAILKQNGELMEVNADNLIAY
jgi:hypothetical protein